MSNKRLTAVWDKSTQSGTKLLVLLSLADRADDDGFCWPSLKDTAQRSRTQRSYATTLIREIEKDGELYIHQRPGFTNQYIVTVGLTPQEIKTALMRRFKMNANDAQDGVSKILTRQGVQFTDTTPPVNLTGGVQFTGHEPSPNPKEPKYKEVENIPDPVCEACGEPTSKLIQASYKGTYFKVCSTCDIRGSLPKALRPDKNAHAKNVINAMGVFETKTRSIEDDCRVYLNYTPDWKVKANGELMSFLIEQKRIGHMVEEFSRWYWAVFWKGQKGQPPTSKDIRENWYAAFSSTPTQTQKPSILQGMSPA